MLVVTDTFTDTDGTALSSHTGELGATWTNNVGGAVVASGRVRPSGSGSNMVRSSGTPATAEYDVVGLVVRVSDTTMSGGVCGRCSTSGAVTGYLVQWSDDQAQWQMYLVNAGSFSLLGTYDENILAGASQLVKLEIRDAAKKAFLWNGSAWVERISSADNTVTAVGRGGVWWFDGDAVGANGVGLHVDTFSVEDLSSAGSVLSPRQVSGPSYAAVRAASI